MKSVGRRVPYVVSAVVLLALAGWQLRGRLTEEAADAYLRSQGVEADYRVAQVSPTRLVLDRVRLGNPAAPDLTARRIEVAIAGYPLQPRITSARLVAPRLRAVLRDGQLSFGSLDALLPEADQPAGPLPDTDVRVEDGRLLVETPAGAITMKVSADGRLSNGFAGRAEIVLAKLDLAGCGIEGLTGVIRAATRADGWVINGAGQAPSAACEPATVGPTTWRAALRTDVNLKQLAGSLGIGAQRLRHPGATVRSLAADLSFAGDTSRLSGRWRLTAHGGTAPQFRAEGALGSGTFEAELGAKRLALAGTAALQSARVQVPDLADGTSHPLAAALARRAARAGHRFDANARFVAHLDSGRLKARLNPLEATAASGARVRLADGAGIALTSGGLPMIDGRLTMGGGGLPTTVAVLRSLSLGRRPAGEALITLAPWAVDRTSLGVPRLLVRPAASGWSADGRLRYSGVLGGSMTVAGLDLQASALWSAEGTVSMLARCADLSFDRLSAANSNLGATRMQICREGPLGWNRRGLFGLMRSAPTGLTGRLADRPLALDVGEARVAANAGRMTLRPLTLAGSIGTYRLAGTIEGEAAADGSAGRGRVSAFELAGPDLPVRIEGGRSAWSLANGRLALRDADAIVVDALPDARFQPLRVAATANVVGDQVLASGSGALASSGARLFGFELRHGLAASAGSADLKTGSLEFSDRLQPYQITEALRGVIENVAGRVEGVGQARWDANGITSNGQATLHDVSLATAALGPVTGIAGTVAFDDLFALTTPAGQLVTVATMNPGVLVENGRFRFKMLAPTSARIEDAQWPFAGGTLTLRPVTITAGEVRREFTLDVAGIDAGLFLQRFELSNVNATGSFDGTLPLVFDGDTGRIVGGHLEARSDGGLIQYVGDVGADSMGAAGRLAFDALKRLRYRSLSMTLDGDLDGELVTAVRFAGTNEAPVRPAGGLPVRASGLPFRFNVTVRAPFRGLLGTAASFSDAREVIRSAAPKEEAAPATPPTVPVQDR